MKNTDQSSHVFVARLVLYKLKLLGIIQITLTEPTEDVNAATWNITEDEYHFLLTCPA